jgi:hypothetical protein
MELNNTIPLYNYQKHNAEKFGEITGRGLLVNLSNYCIVDIDVGKNLPEAEKELIRNDFIKVLSDYPIRIVQTGGGGLHLYSIWDSSMNFTQNRNIQIYHSPDNTYVIDVFPPIERDKQSLLVLPGSRVKDSENHIHGYKLIMECIDEELLHFKELCELLKKFGIEFRSDVSKSKTKSKTESITTNSVSEIIVSDLTPERFDLIVKGFAGLTIHNDCSQSIDEEISIYNVVTGLNACENEVITRELIENAIDYIRSNSKLTDKARKFWFRKVGRFIDERSNSNLLLMKILKIHNPVYYDKFLVQRKLEINLNDDFNHISIKEKARKKEYNTEQEVLDDLLLIMAQVVDVFAWKKYDAMNKTYFFKYESRAQIKQYLSQIKLWHDSQGDLVNCWKVFDCSNDTRFDYKGIRFYSDEKDVYSIFHGFGWKILDSVNEAKLEKYFNHSKSIICRMNEQIFNHLHDWVSFIVQNPGKKNGTAFIITGGFGSGKNTFTEVLINLFKRYSKNFENLESAVGKFNSAIENVMFGVFNELVSVDNRKFMNYDGLKQLETGATFTINEKCIPERTAENVINNIYLSNHRIPFKLDENDRRYIVLETDNRYAKGSCSDEERAEYFNALYESFDDEFYDNLLTYYMNRDISKYKPFNIPDTDIKNDIISASRESVQSFVEEHVEMLTVGNVCERVYESYVEFCKVNGFMPKKSTTFGGEIGAYCEHVQKRNKGERKRYYVLKPEFAKKYAT